MTAIELIELGKRFPAGGGIEGLTASIEPGQLVAVVGPSGCGKTTLLRMVAGLLSPDTGDILADGESLCSLPPHRRGIGFVFQEAALYPHLSVRHNLAFPLRRQRVAKSEIERRVAEVAGELRIEGLMDRFPEGLSGGERQRVAIGRAIIRRPRVLLLDEPLSQLDAMLRVRLRDELVRLHRSLRATTILVTHDAAEAMAIADRVLVMADGRLIQQGPPERVYSQPHNRFVAEFFGMPPMNFIEAVVQPHGILCSAALRSLALGSLAPLDVGSPVFVGFRPGDVDVAGRVGVEVDEAGDLVLEVRPERIHREEDRWVVEAHCSAALDGGWIRAVAPRPVPMGAAAGWRISRKKIYLFDPRSGRRIDGADAEPLREGAAGA